MTGTEQPAKMSLDQVVKYFNAGIEEAEVLRSPARSSKLQLEQCLALDLLMYNATQVKRDAIRRDSENHANLFLGFECAIGAVRSELQMWLLLKRDMPNEAWNRLVAAQIACLDATRAHTGFRTASNALKT
ncbi:hypothetical protein [Paraburkholderia unamae]|uniref:Uncharacterized protein n=1 Tax=Paraburkholderia unamae TaxID=219649 RepID=A0ABX5KN92_9BURK|nr:hypothetical protein [Paraburkholderia unamae]PVX83668.1 hypothetical protein C7402_10672 [Paraburkholderia unamae]